MLKTGTGLDGKRLDKRDDCHELGTRLAFEFYTSASAFTPLTVHSLSLDNLSNKHRNESLPSAGYYNLRGLTTITNRYA